VWHAFVDNKLRRANLRANEGQWVKLYKRRLEIQVQGALRSYEDLN